MPARTISVPGTKVPDNQVQTAKYGLQRETKGEPSLLCSKDATVSGILLMLKAETYLLFHLFPHFYDLVNRKTHFSFHHTKLKSNTKLISYYHGIVHIFTPLITAKSPPKESQIGLTT